MSPPALPEVSHLGSAPRARTTATNALAIAVLLGITLAFYHGLWLPGLVLIKRDAYGVFLPLKQHLIERLSAGELPQWFPYDALGRPFIGVTATGVFHPFTALYFFLSIPDAYRASTLLSCLLAALGAFLLGRILRFSHTGALLTGIVFALSGYIVSLTDNIVYLYSICVLPLFCAALEKALVGARAWTVGSALVWASVFLNGDVQRAVVEDYRKNKTIDAFVRDMTMPYVDIEVKNVILDELRQSPYSARIEFLKIYTNPSDHSEIKRERWTASVTYVFRDAIQNGEIQVNPLGLTIVKFRSDQAFD